MLCSTKELDGFSLDARDGDIGHVRDIYFDDQRWVIRHLVVDTGGWLSGRRVLVSPHSVQGVDHQRRRLAIDLSREQIERAPDVDCDRPVSRQQEIANADYYGYPHYWSGAGLWGAAAYPLAFGALTVPPAREPVPGEVQAQAMAQSEAGDAHLRSSAEVVGYHIEAQDGSIGHIEDFLFDERSWQIRYAVVDTRNWLPGRLVLMAPRWIDRVEWSSRRVHVRATREAVKASPPYDSDAPFTATEEQRLMRHYGDDENRR